MSAPRIAVVLPTYQNAGTLERVIDGVLAHVPDLFVVDDGCSDRTAEVLHSRSDVRVVRHATNRGKGVALRTGFAEAHQAGFTHAISLDSDGQHDPGQLPVFLEAIGERPDDLILGARDMSGEHVPRRSLFGLCCSNLSVRMLTGLRLPDTQSGFRAYPLAPVLQLPLRGTRFEFEVEVLVRAARAGVPISSVCIPVYYPPPAERVTHFRPVRDFMRVFWLDLGLLVDRRR